MLFVVFGLHDTAAPVLYAYLLSLSLHDVLPIFTLLSSCAQAAACADSGVFLISPFVVRNYDWYKKANGNDYTGADDPGVQSVTRIYNYYKANDYKTVVKIGRASCRERVCQYV